MQEINIGDLVKLSDGRRVYITNLPNSFMANGSYEVSFGDGTPKFWVKPKEVLYKINKEWDVDINDYLEIIMDENGINIIPKGVTSLDIESVGDFNYIKLNLEGNRKHSVINLYMGDLDIITDTEEEKEEKSFIKKLLDITKNEDE